MKGPWGNLLWNKSVEGLSLNAQDIDQVYFNLQYLNNPFNHYVDSVLKPHNVEENNNVKVL